MLDRYDITWTHPSRNSADSMPCGGGDIGLNVWVEQGDLLFYIARSGAFDESNGMLKLGRVRVRVSSDPFSGDDFRQTLRLREGRVVVEGGGVVATVWVDVHRPVVHVELQSEQPVTARVSFESWRHRDRPLADRERRATSYKIPSVVPGLCTKADTIEFEGNAVAFHHRNEIDAETVFDFTVRHQGMEAVKDQMANPLRGRTLGGRLRGDGFVPAGTHLGEYANADFKAWTLQSVAPSRSQQMQLTLHVAQTDTLAEWKAGLAHIDREADASRETASAHTRAWWAAFWERSYIFIESDDPSVWRIGRNYQVFRYMLGCNARGEWPTKFNGGLFTFDPVHVNAEYPYTPDFRLWGGGVMTAQNQRLVYFPLLRSGDFDLLKPQFDFYLRSLRNAELRSEVYWNHPGACFTEQLENFGLPNVVEWGMKRPEGSAVGVERNAWLEYQWDTVFEFCLMMLETERYEGRDITEYLPLIESCLRFFDEHYRLLARQRGVKELTQEGHYVLYPGTACETFKGAYNASPTIAALKVILTRLLALPDRYLGEQKRVHWATMLSRIPPLPMRQIDGRTMIAPAIVWERIQNTETPQLYPVFPWGLYGVGLADLEIARNTYLHDPHAVHHRSYEGWRQYPIWAARLGLADEAAELTKLKFQDSTRHRFPTFWGPAFDWTPDHNWGGSAMIGLQEMLMQTVGEKIYLLPAWPADWNATFKLHAPRNTVVEATVKSGKITDLRVTPPERRKDVVIPSHS